MSTLTIIRGIPGSGKSTLAKSFNCFHLEADMSITRDGEYCWKPETVEMSHELIHSLAEKIMENNADLVISNTFTRISEMQKYLDLAEEYNYTVDVFRCVGEFGSTHNVPEETIEKMKERFEFYDKEKFYIK